MTSRPSRQLIVLLSALALLAGACGDDDDSAATTTTSSTTTTTSEVEGSDADRSAYLDALAEELANPSGDDIAIDDDRATCVATALIDTVGVERLDQEGVTPQQFATADSFAELGIELDDAEVERLGGEMDACLDFKELLLSTAPDDFGCLVDNLDESRVAQAFATEFASGEPADVGMLMFESAEPACAEQVFLATGVAQGDITEDQAVCVADALDDEVALRILMEASSQRGPSEADGVALQNAFAQCGVAR